MNLVVLLQVSECMASLLARPRLRFRFTDYGWYLPQIAFLIYDACYDILEVSCSDDDY